MVSYSSSINQMTFTVQAEPYGAQEIVHGAMYNSSLAPMWRTTRFGPSGNDKHIPCRPSGKGSFSKRLQGSSDHAT
jgi:hypothetical protein